MEPAIMRIDRKTGDIGLRRPAGEASAPANAAAPVPSKPAGTAARLTSVDPGSTASYTAAAKRSASPDLTRMPSIEDLAQALHRGALARPLLRQSARPPVPTAGLVPSPSGQLDATVEHPTYGEYLREWLETSQPEAGRALLGLLRNALGDLREAISRSGGKSRSVRPTD
jgi:hypothetical protein